MNVRTTALAWSVLLLAVFGWACGQGSPTSPTAALTSAALATSAQLEKEATFTVTFSGDVSGAPQQFVNTTQAKDWLNAWSITLDLSSFQGAVTGGATCFDAAGYTGQLQLAQIGDSPAGIAWFLFEAKATNGTPAGYKLELSGQIGNPESWPGTSNTIQGGGFKLIATPRPKRNGNACVGSGDLTYRIDLARVS